MCLSNVELDWELDSLIKVYPLEGPTPQIPPELVIEAIKLMKCGKASCTSLVVTELLKTSGVVGARQSRDRIEDIIHFGKIPTGWEESIIVSHYKGKGVVLG